MDNFPLLEYVPSAYIGTYTCISPYTIIIRYTIAEYVNSFSLTFGNGDLTSVYDTFAELFRQWSVTVIGRLLLRNKTDCETDNGNALICTLYSFLCYVREQKSFELIDDLLIHERINMVFGYDERCLVFKINSITTLLIYIPPIITIDSVCMFDIGAMTTTRINPGII